MTTKNKVVRSLAVGTVLLLGAAAAQAQNAPVGSSAAQAALQGTWNVRMTPYECSTGETYTFAAFWRRLGINSGGTLSEANFNPTFQPGQRSSGLGSWERTGPKTYRALTEAYVFFTTPRYARGFQRIDETINLKDADHYAGSGRVEFTDEQGNVGITGCFNTVGERQQ
jgi:hypothetical protein